MARVLVYDTTLRDGTQWEGISLSVEDKLKIAAKLDEFRIDYIEGGWPGSNPKDIEFFRRVPELGLQHAKVVAFGSTRRPHTRAEDDYNLRMLVEANTPAVALVSKSWDLHVTEALRTTLEENLAMVRDSVRYLVALGREVIFDAEHFFDGFRANRDYALAVLRAAAEAGAHVLVLCDTNGGSLPWDVEAITATVVGLGLGPMIGVHTHNDSGNAVANALAAVRAGARHVQGTINGYGERCGNADLCQVIPNLMLKLGYDVLPRDVLARLTELSWYVSEVANVAPNDHQPYVGRSAFAHKGGIHVSAVLREARTYEHIDPALVGNERRVVVSELAGRSNLLYKARAFQLDLDEQSPEWQKILQLVKDLEYRGYQFEGADASLELLMKKALGLYQPLFQLEGFRVTVEKREDDRPYAEATIKVSVDGEHEHTAAEGDGPVHALDNALRKALLPFYPALADIHLTDFKVRVLDAQDGTAAQVRVLMTSADERGTWSTVGVSENILEAAWQALVDSIEYGLRRRAGEAGPRAARRVAVAAGG
ncbi:MAG TPA: citramalate synthase [Chloroflexota bacterium]|jgi:2-isopropylmalate synthase|nr:citramalate synthase [Chloroflexota bacterium]